MQNYTTQMDAARKGIVTPQMEIVAKKEQMPVEKLMELVASGKGAIPANKLHTALSPEGIGKNCRTKINVNLGVCLRTGFHEWFIGADLLFTNVCNYKHYMVLCL